MRVAIVLAAGSSRRFGPANKLLARVAGRRLVAYAVAAAEAAPVARVFVVVGADHLRVAKAVRSATRVTVVRARDYREGIAASLRAAHAALRPIEREAFVFLGDMPAVPHGLALRLARVPGSASVRPRHRGAPGHPVLVRGPLLKAMGNLRGDQGLHDEAMRWIEAGRGCVADVDRRHDLSRAKGKRRG